MRVLVTGASGFVGSHTVRALIDAGHEVRASARSAERVRRALAPLGCADAVEPFEAAIEDEPRVREALAGCDAVVHAAAIYSHDPRLARRQEELNPRGAEVVLGTACELGLDPVLHVSSYVALLPSGRQVLTPDAPLGDPPTPYARSKARADAVARRLQTDGAPVTIVYPGMVWGPHDPAWGESARLARDLLRRRIPLGVPGAVPVADVRDLAAVHAAALMPGQGPRRFLVGAELVPFTELCRTVARAGGVRPPRGVMSPAAILALGRACDALRRAVPLPLPLNYQGPWTALNSRALDVTATREQLGVEFRPAAQTLAESAAWVRDSLGATEPSGEFAPRPG